ncbi:ShlB/FhaC/HecB family hemolysin secretion/activation protein, partial [Variovorax defluvii]|uniref:ShlB/FhaC/HecB family hemolysin secretion/activation protein n=1 Tax=Variovorax defluvii TaxID=913761 RepID=UPI0031F0D4DD
LYTADISLNAPFTLGGQKLRYSGLVRAQRNRTPLSPQDRFAIGGRYTVRGFDGETNLLGERGWLIRSDIGWAMGQSGAELYVGMDHGRVSGPSTVALAGRSLTGAVAGVRGQWSRLSYDFFTGAPIRQPEGYRTAGLTLGFNLHAGF